MKLTILFLACSLSLSMAKIRLVPPIAKVSIANNVFAARMYQELAKTPGNIFFSPISAHAVLSLVAQGASGKTLEEFTKVLGVDKNTAADGYQGLIRYLNHLNLHLHMANKVYIQQNYRIKQTFKTVASNKFLTEAESINFTDNKNAASNINKWCNGKTHNKIKDIMKTEDVDGLTRMILLNAIYFQGDWLFQFNKTYTKKADFFVSKTVTAKVDMMSITSKFKYAKNSKLDAQILEMNYISDDVSMLIILPNDKNGITNLEKKLVGLDFANVIKGMEYAKVDLYLPKFKLESSIELKSVLQQMGIVRAFGNADFSQLLDLAGPLSISNARQKAFIVVNEEGSAAAASSSISTVMKTVPELIKFVADHPFIIAIQVRVQRWSNTLFLGKIVNPLNTK